MYTRIYPLARMGLVYSTYIRQKGEEVIERLFRLERELSIKVSDHDLERGLLV